MCFILACSKIYRTISFSLNLSYFINAKYLSVGISIFASSFQPAENTNYENISQYLELIKYNSFNFL